VFRLILEESYFIVFDYYCTLAVWGILLVSNPAGSWAAIGATGYKYYDEVLLIAVGSLLFIN